MFVGSGYHPCKNFELDSYLSKSITLPYQPCLRLQFLSSKTLPLKGWEGPWGFSVQSLKKTDCIQFKTSSFIPSPKTTAGNFTNWGWGEKKGPNRSMGNIRYVDSNSQATKRKKPNGNLTKGHAWRGCVYQLISSFCPHQWCEASSQPGAIIEVGWPF